MQFQEGLSQNPNRPKTKSFYKHRLRDILNKYWEGKFRKHKEETKRWLLIYFLLWKEKKKKIGFECFEEKIKDMSYKFEPLNRNIDIFVDIGIKEFKVTFTDPCSGFFLESHTNMEIWVQLMLP